MVAICFVWLISYERVKCMLFIIMKEKWELFMESQWEN